MREELDSISVVHEFLLMQTKKLRSWVQLDGEFLLLSLYIYVQFARSFDVSSQGKGKTAYFLKAQSEWLDR